MYLILMGVKVKLNWNLRWNLKWYELLGILADLSTVAVLLGINKPIWLLIPVSLTLIYLIIKWRKERKRTPISVFNIEEWEKKNKISVFIRRFKEFIGRDDELSKLNSFLDSKRNIAIISGLGGVGKTRLLIEFARRVKLQRSWQVFFVDDYELDVKVIREFISKYNHVILILDDLSNFTKIEDLGGLSLLDHSIKSDEINRTLKIIISTRPIFVDTITRRIESQRGFESPFHLEVKGGDFKNFIDIYYPDIEDDNILDALIENTRENFDSLIAILDSYSQTGEISGLKEVFNYKYTVYIKEAEQRTGLDGDDIEGSYYLLSLIKSLRLSEDLKYIKNTQYYDLVKILPTLRKRKCELLFYSKNKYSLRPDTHADFILSKLINSKPTVFKQMWSSLAPIMPLRICMSILASGIWEENSEYLKIVLQDIWDELIRIKGKTIEYIASLSFFTRDLYHLNLFDVSVIDIEKLRKNVERIISRHDKEIEEAVFLWGSTLLNLIIIYANKGDEEKSEICLRELQELRTSYNSKKINDLWIRGFLFSIVYITKKKKISELDLAKFNEKISLYNEIIDELDFHPLFNQLFKATTKYTTEDETIEIEKIVENILKESKNEELMEKLDFWIKGSSDVLKDIEIVRKQEFLFKKLLHLDDKYNIKLMSLTLLKILSNEIGLYGELGDINKVIEKLNELKERSKKIADEGSIEYLVSGMQNALTAFGSAGNITKAEEILNEIELIVSKITKPSIITSYAIALSNLCQFYGVKKDFNKLEDSLLKLEDLMKDNMDIDLLKLHYVRGLTNSIFHYGESRNFKKMEEQVAKILEVEKNLKIKDSMKILVKALTDISKESKIDENLLDYDSLSYSLHSMQKEKETLIKILSSCAEGLLNASKAYVDINDISKAEEYLSKILDIKKRFNIESINSAYALTLSNIANYYSQYGDEKKVSELLDIVSRLPNVTTTERLSKSLASILIYKTLVFGKKGKIEDVEDAFQELFSLYQIHMSKDFAGLLTTGGNNSIITYALCDKPDGIEEILSILISLEEDWEDLELAILLAESIRNSIAFYASKKQFKQVDIKLKLLKQLNNKYKSSEINKEINNAIKKRDQFLST